jgi:hypothetical protein
MLIHATTIETIPALKTQIDQALAPCQSLEEAAQTCTNLLFETFEESLILIRFLATIPYQALPPAYQSVATMLTNAEQTNDLIHDDTPVLTLLGTRGGDEDLRNTRHAFGVPLVSRDFVASIPLVAQLLQEIGCDLHGRARPGSQLHNQHVETESTGFLSGMLYVPDAQQVATGQGEPLLPAITRLPLYRLKSASAITTIFGIGGEYIQGPYIAMMMFSREHLEKSEVERFMPVANYFKTATLKLAMEGRIFT